MKNMKRSRGFIKQILIIIVAIVVLNYVFKINIRDWLDKPEIRLFFVHSWQIIQFVTTHYVITPLLSLWDNIYQHHSIAK